MNELKVLVSGMDLFPNQLTRAVEGYGCKVYHVNGDPGKNFPRFCDIAIIGTKVSSHQKVWDVKDAYKEQKKPVLVTNTGFSEIRERFEELLVKRGIRLPQKSFNNTIAIPENWSAPKVVEPKVENKPIQMPTPKPEKKPMSVVDRIVHLKTAGKTYLEIATILNAEGYRRPRNNDKYADTDVSCVMQRVRGSKASKAKLTRQSPAKDNAITNTPKSEVAVPITDLIQVVIASTEHDESSKLKLISRITKGEIKAPVFTDEVVVDDSIHLELTDIAKKPSSNVQVQLTKDQAALVLRCLGGVMKFLGVTSIGEPYTKK
jgi:hypothetical protein